MDVEDSLVKVPSALILHVSGDILRPGVQTKLDALHALYEVMKVIVGHDKLDVVKGIVQKVSAISVSAFPHDSDNYSTESLRKTPG